MKKYIHLQQHGHFGYESCERGNLYTKTCACGFAEKNYKPCVWNGSSYVENGTNHVKWCINGHMILERYYMYSYGNGKIYEVENAMEECINSNGEKLTCEKSGRCTICGIEWNEGIHYLENSERGRQTCKFCGKDCVNYSYDVKTTSKAPITYTVTMKVKLSEGYQFYSVEGFKNNQNIWNSTGYTAEVSNLNSSKTEFTLKCTGMLKDNVKATVVGRVVMKVSKLGRIFYINMPFTDSGKVSPTCDDPSISNIQVENNEWTKSKPITISGTENWTNTVNVAIMTKKFEIICEGEAIVKNNNWSINFIPELEADEAGSAFMVRVTNPCDGLVLQDFDISKVDGKPPTVTSSDMATDSEWAKEKTFTFTAEDLGIGNVEIGFNDVNDYSLAVQDGTNYSKEYKFVGDAYSPVKASVYFKDGLGNITTQLVTLEKIDNTAPTITNVVLNNSVLNITAHDRHSTLGEGSGVIKYRYITSTEKLENPEITVDNSQEISKDELFTIPNINEVKYIYVVAEDMVGNTSESYEIEVPKITLKNSVNTEGANGKGEVLLDWTGYDISNKYFVIYRKKEDEEEWKTVVGIDDKLNDNTYTDTFGNDITKPSMPETTIEKNIEEGQIKIKPKAIDNGTTYIYYIEAYDKNTGELIAKSNIN